MANWKDELADKIAAMTDDDWDHIARLLVPTGDGSEVAIGIATKEFDVPAPPIDPDELSDMNLIGTVNDRDFCGAEAGTLLIVSLFGHREMPEKSWDGMPPWDCSMRLALSSKPWNQILDPANLRYKEVRDSDGNTIYRAIDFDTIPA